MNKDKRDIDNEAPPLLKDIYSREEISDFILTALMSTETESIYIKDPSGRLNLVNAKLLNDMTPFTQDEIVGKTDKELFGTEFGIRTQREEQQLYETGKPIASLEEVRTGSNNNKEWSLTTKIPLKDHEEKIIGLIGFTKQINEIKEKESKLRELATHDDLTHVFNRNGLFERLDQMKQQTNIKLGLLILDVDDFKKINDQYLHTTGDEFLKWLAWILKVTTRGNDVVARYGGDEFVVIMNEIHDYSDIESFCQKLYRNFDNSIDERFKSLGVNISIGISMYPTDSKDSDQLIEMADKALYWVKNHGKGAYQFFNYLENN
ncbi:GGDEF domain-containing protein [bacterium]|nr:GGDEF domain-containing protein [bacterium]